VLHEIREPVRESVLQLRRALLLFPRRAIGEQLDLAVEAGETVSARRYPVIRRYLRQRRRGQHRPADLLGRALDPLHPVHHPADAGECQPVRHPDIAEHQLADIEPDAEFERRVRRRSGVDNLDPEAQRLVDRRHRPAHRLRRAVGAVAPDLDREDRQHPVADEVQDLAAMLDHRRRGAFEILVQQRQIVVRRHLVGEPGRGPQVREPHHRRDPFAVAALDVA